MTRSAPPEVRQRTLAKARVLLEALPYFREHAGSTVVIKVGGAAMDAGRLAESFAEDVALLRLVGVRPVIVHGGGPQITEMAARLGIEASFIDGHRVTDAATLEVARMVLLGLVNQDLVSHLVRRGPRPWACRAATTRCCVVRPRAEELGLVGEVESGEHRAAAAPDGAVVPVIASIGTDREGQAYNVNADLVAGAVAAALGAEKLVYLTDVPGPAGRRGRAGHRDQRGGGAGAAGERRRRRRHDPQARERHPGDAGRRAPGPPDRRPRGARADPRAVHARGPRHDAHPGRRPGLAEALARAGAPT